MVFGGKVEERVPGKQGLKPFGLLDPTVLGSSVEERVPGKQGLKQDHSTVKSFEPTRSKSEFQENKD